MEKRRELISKTLLDDYSIENEIKFFYARTDYL